MRKSLFIVILINLALNSYANITLPDFNSSLDIPNVNSKKIAQNFDQSEDKTLFSFNLGKIDGDISILGNWKLKVGFGTGFTLYPELRYLVSVSGMKEGIIFEQKRLISLDWVTENGIFLHLFFNDDMNATEYTFKYELGKVFNGFYITNKFSGLEVNPYRKLKGGKAQDINFGFDWKAKFYNGRFDLQFDSVRAVTDTFRGNKKYLQNKLLSAQYIRGIYYFLPDTKISGYLEVYVGDPFGDEFTDITFNSGVSEARRYKKLSDGIDYKINPTDGYITFKSSVYGKTVLIYYQANINGTLYGVGDINCGKSIINGTTDFNKTSNPEYFARHDGKDFLILSYQSKFSYFEEKNSYKITESGAKVSSLATDIFDNNNQRISGFSVIYDDFGGALRIKSSLQKGNPSNIYTFNAFVTPADFYLNFASPSLSLSKNSIDYSCYVSGEGLKLTAKPVSSSLRVFFNSLLLDPSKYSYDFITQSINLNFDVNDTDYIEVMYVTDDIESYNLTGVLKNDFRLNDYFLIGDSFWYKMPIKLWEDSYYYKLHSMEFLYNFQIKVDFKKILNDKKNGKFGFNINETLSVFYPELKGVTIVEDFETQLRGINLSLDYKDWFPVSIPIATFTPAMDNSKFGQLFFRNMHKSGNTTNKDYLSIYDTNPSPENWSSGNTIGPYSSSDGYNGEKNTLSLITEFNLGANEAVSIALPLALDSQNDYSRFAELTAAIKKIELTGSVRLYFDAGSVTELFNSSDTTVQKEQVDEGIKYSIVNPSAFNMYKSRGDGINVINDFDNNGVLDDDTVTNITKFNDVQTALNYIDITGASDKSVANFKILNPERLKNIRALRLTIYSQSGASGRLLFNQLRLLESGWDYDKTKTSDATEIFPAEDPDLNNHIFSVDNKTFDSKLHFQRFRERTLRVRLKKSESFYIEKRLFNPVEISYFKKFGFFTMLKYPSGRKIKLTLIDTVGNEMSKTTDLSYFTQQGWNQIVNYFTDFDGYANNNKSINTIRIDFLNEASEASNTFDNVLFLDEFYMDESNTFVGFGSKNEFVYQDPGLKLETKSGFTIFSSPSIKMITGFSTENFLNEEMKPNKNYLLSNDSSLGFRFVTIDFGVNSYFDYIFRNYSYYNPNETLRLKISRTYDKNLPLLFTIFYDYKRSGLPDFINNWILSSKSEERKILLELGGQTQYFTLKTGYDIDTIKNITTTTQNKINGEIKLSFENVNYRTLYNISNKRQRPYLSGNFSLDNLTYIFSEDFTSFGYEGDEKFQFLESNLTVNLLPLLTLSNNVNVRQFGLFSNNSQIYNFGLNYLNKISFEVKIEYNNDKKIFFTGELSRRIDDSFAKIYQSLNWSDYFDNFSKSITNNGVTFFYPPFSSLYNKAGLNMFGQNTRFDLLSDSLRMIFDWSAFLDKRFFIPNKFIFNFIESISNSVFYNPSYNFIFTLSGLGYFFSAYFREINSEYIITEDLNLKNGENIYKTQTSISLNFYLFNGMDIESAINYDITYYESTLRKEISQSIIFKAKIYKDFYKKNFVTNDKYGFDLNFLLEVNSSFYNRFDKITEMLDSPLKLYFTPSLGYRFNRNVRITGNTKLGYNLEYSQQTGVIRNNFAAEFFLEGVLTF